MTIAVPTKLLAFTLIAILAFVVFACSTSPLGRKQLHLFPSSALETLGENAFAEVKSKTPQTKDPMLSDYVSCVAVALITPLGDPGAWEVVVFDQDSVNAFALPGRKIGVYQGLLEVAATQDQLAAVIGHEVAHVLAEHSNERLSNEYLVGTVVDMVAGRASVSPGAYAALGLGAQVGILLPYGRTQEEEADLVGLDLMAQAGFDPAAAVTLWQKMSQREKRNPPEFLSTHPADDTRIESLQARLPAAQAAYRARLEDGSPPVCRPPHPTTPATAASPWAKGLHERLRRRLIRRHSLRHVLTHRASGKIEMGGRPQRPAEADGQQRVAQPIMTQAGRQQIRNDAHHLGPPAPNQIQGQQNRASGHGPHAQPGHVLNA